MQDPKDYKPDTNILADRVILITGAGDGIGAVAAKTFAAHGATTILLGRTVKKLEAVYDTIESAGYPQPAIYPLDLEGAAPADYDEMAAAIGDEFGRLDGLLHNAAFLGALTPLEQYDLKTWYRVMQINLNAPYLLTRSCLGLLKQSRDASVLFTGSGVGRHGRAYWGAYAVSKAADENLMQIWADELEANTPVRVNSINPGAVRTAMRAKAFPGEDPETLPTPESIMPAYLWLMGPDSKGVTGRQVDAQ